MYRKLLAFMLAFRKSAQETMSLTMRYTYSDGPFLAPPDFEVSEMLGFFDLAPAPDLR
jgi:hypothetical protein